MMFFVPPERRMDVIRALSRFDGQVSNCHFTQTGAYAWSGPQKSCQPSHPVFVSAKHMDLTTSPQIHAVPAPHFAHKKGKGGDGDPSYRFYSRQSKCERISHVLCSWVETVVFKAIN